MPVQVNGLPGEGVDPFRPAIAPEIWRLRPDFAALSLVARGVRNAPSGAWPVPAEPPAPPAWAREHLAAWREAYAAFGAKPQRTPCSAEALWKRVQRGGGFAGVNAVVDLYNAVSLRFAVPVGGEDLSRYVGAPRLVRAEGGEAFETMRDGVPATEPAEPGEVIWRDDAGVTCRRWNWRQTRRTRLDAETTEMWFVLERLAPMPIEALLEAGEAIVAGLRRLAPAARFSRTLLEAPAVSLEP